MGFLELVKLLVENGAYIFEQNKSGETPLTLAINCKYKEIEQFLSKYEAQ